MASPAAPSRSDQHPGDSKDEELLSRKHDHIISTLQQSKSKNQHRHYLYQGFWYPEIHIKGALSAQELFQAQPTDILIVTTPKSGTTWIKALAFAIANRNRYHLTSPTHPLLVSNPHECVPSLESSLFRSDISARVDYVSVSSHTRVFASHFPYTSLPNSVLASQCRILYNCRNPKDLFVSMWHFAIQVMKDKGTMVSGGPTMEEMFESFCQGTSTYGPYWDHVLGYYKASLESPERVLFLKYEDLHRDILCQVKRIAAFLGYPFSLEEEAQGVVEDVVKLCSFKNLSNLDVNKTGSLRSDFKNRNFFRKGQVGDSKNYLTTEMIERLDSITKEKFDPYGLYF